MCGQDGKLVPICPNGHFMHLECLKGWVKNTAEPSCPECRDPYLTEMKAFFEDNPYEYQPPSPGPVPNPFDFATQGRPNSMGVMNQLMANVYMQQQHAPPRMVTTTRTTQNFPVPGGYMHVETVRRGQTSAPPPLFQPRRFRRPTTHPGRPPGVPPPSGGPVVYRPHSRYVLPPPSQRGIDPRYSRDRARIDRTPFGRDSRDHERV